MKRPSFQFYPADWRKDMGLQACSIGARGLWIEMMCIAHECEPYGHLMVNGKAMQAAHIARHVGISAREAEKLIQELADAGVLSTTAEGAIFSRRMVRDEDLRNRRGEGGKAGSQHGIKGAEHGAKGGRPPKGRGVSEPPLEPPPSSSSSSSSSTSMKTEREVTPPPVAAREAPNGAEAPPAPSPRGCRLPRDWEPGPEHEAFAATLGLRNGLLAGELAKFRDHWASQPGSKGVKADWGATWRNWLRKAVEYGAAGQRPQHPVESTWQREARENVERMTGGLASIKPPKARQEVLDGLVRAVANPTLG